MTAATVARPRADAPHAAAPRTSKPQDQDPRDPDPQDQDPQDQDPQDQDPSAAEESPSARIRATLQRLAVAVIDKAAGAAADKVDELADKLDDVKESGGVGLAAALGAGAAQMAGKNPVVGAMKGAWGALGTGTKVAIVVGLVLLGVLSPVALVLILVGLLVAAIVKASRG